MSGRSEREKRAALDVRAETATHEKVGYALVNGNLCYAYIHNSKVNPQTTKNAHAVISCNAKQNTPRPAPLICRQKGMNGLESVYLWK